ncbi:MULTISPECIES: hypothetical protein [Lysobacter]|jgi:hypothetical protein|uniref:Transmembrane protein n=1 Tax=Lysobacter yananisis TaxID=1003114 RepID=A0ABY9P5E6_9GAMM|nr:MULTISPECIES: hypothetical protein [Lysobacter]UZW58558.1 hypothetical protein BV903_014640 [Lysobacter enzymogenes]WMT02270.1 hypothetical protein RDV84_20225 [Lysobacter yananisis]
MSGERLQSRHWLGKGSAGLILGFGLALALSGVFAWLGPDGIHGGGGGKIQFVMWLIAPLWCAVFSLVFLFRSSARAWLWLGAANALAFAALAALRSWAG